MLILKPNQPSYSFYYLGRPDSNGDPIAPDGFRILNQDRNVDTGGISNSSFDEYYTKFNIVSINNFQLKEGVFYYIKIFKGTEVIYRDTIFCTDQTPVEGYSINKDEYKEHETTNEYIVL
mgnify:CR=1 FL=1|tara:strand:+ start:4091 stop:4450 length:360 start_codon:yes stop_codon:yes gene_type:complete